MENNGNFSIVNMGDISGMTEKIFLREQLGLTSCEVSFGALPAGQEVPFLHAHKENEEIYVFLRGNGVFLIDGQDVAVCEGSVIKVAPAGKRGLKAGNADLIYACVQAKENSLKQATMDDGIIG